MAKPKFLLGHLVQTSGVAAESERNPDFARFVTRSLKKYAQCDWGNTYEEDAEMNNLAIRGVTESRLMGVYNYPGDSELNIWIITEWDHSCTTILFPREY